MVRELFDNTYSAHTLMRYMLVIKAIFLIKKAYHLHGHATLPKILDILLNASGV